jgi:hypothetical protein
MKRLFGFGFDRLTKLIKVLRPITASGSTRFEPSPDYPIFLADISYDSIWLFLTIARTTLKMNHEADPTGRAV